MFPNSNSSIRLSSTLALAPFSFDYSYYVGFEVHIISLFLCTRNMYFINKNTLCWLLLFTVHVGRQAKHAPVEALDIMKEEGM